MGIVIYPAVTGPLLCTKNYSRDAVCMNSLGEVEAIIIPRLQTRTVSYKIVYLANGDLSSGHLQGCSI